MDTELHTLALVVLHYAITAGVIWRVLLRDILTPPVRLAWVMVVGLLPVVGPLAYLMFGEVRMRRSDKRRARDVERRLHDAWVPEGPPATIPDVIAPAFAMGRSMSGFVPTDGNRAFMLPEDDSALDDLVRAIDAAQDHVHALFYIWLPDASGTRVAQAIMRAVARGVTARVLVDDLGSRQLIRSDLWQQMQAAGVKCAVSLPIGNPLIEMIYKRLDLRNHRKIVVVDNGVTWAGSRNCADAAFAIKPRFAPWIDVLMRIEGPIVRQFQSVFLRDWMLAVDEDLSDMLSSPAGDIDGGFTGQVIASGPDQSLSGMSETLSAMLYAARERVMITTPYFLPDSALLEAICACAARGVSTTLILPERNDSRTIAAASEGLYQTLLRSGVRLHLFRGGLLHAKIMSVDGHYAMVGSANLDRRSFDLNYECNLLVSCPRVAHELDIRQTTYLDRAREVTLAEVRGWSALRRIRNNALALAGPLL